MPREGYDLKGKSLTERFGTEVARQVMSPAGPLFDYQPAYTSEKTNENKGPSFTP